MIADGLLCILSTYIAFYLRLGEWPSFFNAGGFSATIPILVSSLLSIPVFILYGIYREIFRFSTHISLLRLTKASFLYGLIYAFIFVIVGVNGVPRTIGIIQPIVLLFLVGFLRLQTSYWLGANYRKQQKLEHIPKVFIFGAGVAGRQLATALEHSYEMRVAGFMDDDVALQGGVIGGVKIFNPANLADLAEKYNVARVLLALPSLDRLRREKILQSIKSAGLQVLTLPSMSQIALGKISANNIVSYDIHDLLERDLVLPNEDLLFQNIKNRAVLVTGAGGSIGSELCRQLLDLGPSSIVLVEQSEFALYRIHQELVKKFQLLNSADINIVPILCDVTNIDGLEVIIRKHHPYVIFHAAAYKHVPLVESNPIEGVRNNVIGTLNIAVLAKKIKTPHCVLISTDKAVRPTNVMGASKRLAEMILQALAKESNNTKFSMVRFGNVLDSSGSVVPKFRDQIMSGGPVTVTDYQVTRFFMTIPEAAQLVIQAGALAAGGDVFLLDMGKPVRIMDLALRMIGLSGLEVKDSENQEGDIEIVEIGLRPGEKLYEELLIDGNPESTVHPRIFKSHEPFLEWCELELKIHQVNLAINANDSQTLIKLLKELVSGYQPSN